MKASKLEEMVEGLYAFCQKTKNAHKRVKDWARDMRKLVKGLVAEVEQLHDECATNDREMKKLRHLLVGHAEASLIIMERSISQPPANCSSPIRRKGADRSPILTELPPAQREPSAKPDERRKKKAKMKRRRPPPRRP